MRLLRQEGFRIYIIREIPFFSSTRFELLFIMKMMMIIILKKAAMRRPTMALGVLYLAGLLLHRRWCYCCVLESAWLDIIHYFMNHQSVRRRDMIRKPQKTEGIGWKSRKARKKLSLISENQYNISRDNLASYFLLTIGGYYYNLPTDGQHHVQTRSQSLL